MSEALCDRQPNMIGRKRQRTVFGKRAMHSADQRMKRFVSFTVVDERDVVACVDQRGIESMGEGLHERAFGKAIKDRLNIIDAYGDRHRLENIARLRENDNPRVVARRYSCGTRWV